MTQIKETAGQPRRADLATAEAIADCEALRAALTRVVTVIDGGTTSIHRVLQQSASLRHARAALRQHGARA